MGVRNDRYIDEDSWVYKHKTRQVSRNIAYGGGKGDSPDAPDYTKIAAAQEKAAEYGYQAANEDLSFRKEQYQNSLPYQRELYGIASQVAQQQLGLGQLSQEQARQQLDSYNSTYRPIELQTVLDSLGSQYLSEEDVAQAVKYLTDPRYDETETRATRQVPYTEFMPETTTSREVTTADSPAASQSGFGPGYNPNLGLNKGRQPSAPAKTTKDTTTTSQKAITKYKDEEYVSGKTKSLNKDYEQERAVFFDQLAKKAQEGAATRAGEGVQAQTNSAVGQQTRSLARMGLNSGRLQANLAATAQQQALTNTGQMNNARTQLANQQIGLRTGVANFGRNMPNTAGQAIGTSANVGSQAVGNQNTGFMSGLAYPQYVSGAYGNRLNAAGIASQGALGLGGLMNQGYATASQNANSGGDFLGGALGLAGSLGAAYISSGAFAASDKKIKQNIKLVGMTNDGLNIYTFEYKPEYQGTWGKGTKMGVMADEVEAQIPDAVVTHRDGYKMVNYAMIGA